MANGLYPHRIASFFSTIQDCMEMVRDADALDRSLNGSGYPTVFVTRLDVISHVFMKGDKAW